jgi:hypothetical protein
VLPALRDAPELAELKLMAYRSRMRLATNSTNSWTTFPSPTFPQRADSYAPLADPMWLAVLEARWDDESWVPERRGSRKLGEALMLLASDSEIQSDGTACV